MKVWQIVILLVACASFLAMAIAPLLKDHDACRPEKRRKLRKS